MKTKTRHDHDIETNGDEDLSIQPLTRAEVAEAASYSREEAMAIVSLYYTMQKLRIGASNKVSAHEREMDILSSSSIVVRLKSDLFTLEKGAGRSLNVWAKAQPLGQWAMTNLGVGPIITAGLLAHIDIHRAMTAGAIWRFAGLDPTLVWEKGEKRPYNARLKTLCFKLGESFKKSSLDKDMLTWTDKQLISKMKEDYADRGKTLTSKDIPQKLAERKVRMKQKWKEISTPSGLYVRLYMERKKLEVHRNEKGMFREQAQARLEKAIKFKHNISQGQRATWQAGKIQDVGLDLRAMRFAVKIFLSHYHQVGRQLLGLEVVKPWVQEHGGHVHMYRIPNRPMGVDE